MQFSKDHPAVGERDNDGNLIKVPTQDVAGRIIAPPYRHTQRILGTNYFVVLPVGYAGQDEFSIEQPKPTKGKPTDENS